MNKLRCDQSRDEEKASMSSGDGSVPVSVLSIEERPMTTGMDLEQAMISMMDTNVGNPRNKARSSFLGLPISTAAQINVTIGPCPSSSPLHFPPSLVSPISLACLGTKDAATGPD